MKERVPLPKPKEIQCKFNKGRSLVCLALYLCSSGMGPSTVPVATQAPSGLFSCVCRWENETQRNSASLAPGLWACGPRGCSSPVVRWSWDTWSEMRHRASRAGLCFHSNKSCHNCAYPLMPESLRCFSHDGGGGGGGSYFHWQQIFVQLNLLVDFISGDNREHTLMYMRLMWDRMPGTYIITFILYQKAQVVWCRNCSIWQF